MATAKKLIAPKPAAGVIPKTGLAPALTSPKVAVNAPAKPAAAAAKPAVKAVTKPSPKPMVAKPVKAKKPKLVRDSFTIPKPEYLVLDELKARANKLANPAKKSELLRAGIKALASMTDTAFTAALKAVPPIKTGRPAKD